MITLTSRCRAGSCRTVKARSRPTTGSRWPKGAASSAGSQRLQPRAKALPFRPFRLIDDVLWDLHALAEAGGRAPVCGALTYRYQLRPGQLTESLARRFDGEYAAAPAELQKNPASLRRAAP